MGAGAGALATAPMTGLMLWLYRKLPPRQRYPLPPAIITHNALRKADITPAPRGELRSTIAGHFAYGACAGAVYAAAAGKKASNPALGAAYGLAVWAVSYLGWIPLAGLMRPATDEPARRNALMIAAHVVWGFSLARFLGRASAGAS